MCPPPRCMHACAQDVQLQTQAPLPAVSAGTTLLVGGALAAVGFRTVLAWSAIASGERSRFEESCAAGVRARVQGQACTHDACSCSCSCMPSAACLPGCLAALGQGEARPCGGWGAVMQNARCHVASPVHPTHARVVGRWAELPRWTTATEPLPHTPRSSHARSPARGVRGRVRPGTAVHVRRHARRPRHPGLQGCHLRRDLCSSSRRQRTPPGPEPAGVRHGRGCRLGDGRLRQRVRRLAVVQPRRRRGAWAKCCWPPSGLSPPPPPPLWQCPPGRCPLRITTTTTPHMLAACTPAAHQATANRTARGPCH